mmetsp:Transcript_30431/g.69666  ORF Transcript_30431/g.69666 Transcript_30431/m.69666 type:complete len:296 (+) Transcript_30431:303-1190(+)
MGSDSLERCSDNAVWVSIPMCFGTRIRNSHVIQYVLDRFRRLHPVTRIHGPYPDDAAVLLPRKVVHQRTIFVPVDEGQISFAHLRRGQHGLLRGVRLARSEPAAASQVSADHEGAEGEDGSPFGNFLHGVGGHDHLRPVGRGGYVRFVGDVFGRHVFVADVFLLDDGAVDDVPEIVLDVVALGVREMTEGAAFADLVLDRSGRGRHVVHDGDGVVDVIVPFVGRNDRGRGAGHGVVAFYSYGISLADGTHLPGDGRSEQFFIFGKKNSFGVPLELVLFGGPGGGPRRDRRSFGCL